MVKSILKSEDFIQLQIDIYDIYQKLCELDTKKDIKRYNSLMERLKYLVGKQDGYFYNINLNEEYGLVQKEINELSGGYTNKLLDSLERSPEEIAEGIFLRAMTTRINNLRNFHTRGYRDEYAYSFENELNKRSIKLLNLEIATTPDEEERKKLIQMFYNILYTNPALESEYLIDPEAFGNETNESSIISKKNKIRGYIDLENYSIKCIVIEKLEEILLLNETPDYYSAYITVINGIYAKAYLSFLSQRDIKEVNENLKTKIEKYVGKIPQEVINHVLDIVSYMFVNDRKGKILPFR